MQLMGTYSQATRQKILTVDIDLIDYSRIMETIMQWRQNGERHYITLASPYTVILCQRDEEMQLATQKASLTIPDGIGIILAANLLGYKHYGRTPGPNLMMIFCEWGIKYGYRHFFYGGKEGIARELTKRLCQKYRGLEVAGVYSPPFRQLTEQEDEAVVTRINSTRPDIVWVGLGAPKQEKWMARHLERIEAAAMIGVGAAFDFHSENIKWAPPWMRRWGLEGLHRIIQEPIRILPRVINNFSFATRVLGQSVTRILTNHKT